MNKFFFSKRKEKTLNQFDQSSITSKK